MRRIDYVAYDDLKRTIRELMTPLKSVNVNALPPSSGAAGMQTVENHGSMTGIPPPKLAENVNVEALRKRDSIKLAEIKKGEKKLFSTTEKVKKQLDSISKSTLAGTPLAIAALPISAKKDTFRNKALSANFYDILPKIPQTERLGMEQRVENSVNSAKTTVGNTIRQNKTNNDNRGKFVYELNMKDTAAVICLVFLFIGAPMGAIIQKGGFGYPILVAIGFFVFYIIGTIYCKNMKDADNLSATSAAWVPVFVMLPIALILTWRAVNDYKMSLDGTGKKLKTMFEKLWNKLPNKKA
jgi:lipopolysaccharide export LptBFGC system permease protein LptF